MALFGRLKTGLALSKDALLVVRHNPGLAVFPLVSGITGFAFLALFLGVTFGVVGVSAQGPALVLLGLTYLTLTFVSSFFAAGLVHETREVLAGKEPSLGRGIEAAKAVWKPLLIWSFISATVGVLINAIENSDSRVARLVGTLFGAAWTLLTFFVVPVIVFEDTTTTGMFKESSHTFKELWGETPISLVAVQLVGLVIALPFVLLGIALSGISPILTAGAILTGALLAFLVSQTLQGVIKTTLYLYATEGVRPDEFGDLDLDGLAGDGRQSARSTSAPHTGGFR
ncbi:DUF6159 family protein [Halovivax limisalsi]|uniref:DUF6159 family protein n=1 Tax=Halovivax limisalsi TaxID=1453760 RepID=UPI001FFDCCCE|nr:DUF6159 family protein [Halovivax limisalsi]